jgi:hypothetical protein
LANNQLCNSSIGQNLIYWLKWAWPSTNIGVAYHKQLRVRNLENINRTSTFRAKVLGYELPDEAPLLQTSKFCLYFSGFKTRPASQY